MSGKAKKWFHPGSNRGPSLRESDVITNYTMKPSTRVAKSLSHEEVKKKRNIPQLTKRRRESQGGRRCIKDATGSKSKGRREEQKGENK